MVFLLTSGELRMRVFINIYIYINRASSDLWLYLDFCVTSKCGNKVKLADATFVIVAGTCVLDSHIGP